MLDYAPQANFIHPARLPNGHLFIGLPLVSMISGKLTNNFSYEDLLNIQERYQTIFERDKNGLGLNVALGDLLVGYRLNYTTYLSLFINERVQGFAHYPSSVVRTYLLQEENENRDVSGSLRVEMTGFREIGLGGSIEIRPGLRLGVHLKYLIGTAYMSKYGNFRYQTFSQMERGNEIKIHRLRFYENELRTSNLPQFEGPSIENFQVGVQDFILGSNHGFAADIGLSYAIHPRLKIESSFRDVGFIAWQNKMISYEPSQEPFEVREKNNGEGLNAQRIIENFLSEYISQPKETTGTHTRMLHYQMIHTLSYKLSANDTFSGSWIFQDFMGADHLGNRSQSVFSLGYNRWFGSTLSLSAAVSVYPHQVAFGTGISLNVGMGQLYLGLEDIAGLINVNTTRMAGFTIGFNLITKRKERVAKSFLCP